MNIIYEYSSIRVLWPKMILSFWAGINEGEIAEDRTMEVVSSPSKASSATVDLLDHNFDNIVVANVGKQTKDATKAKTDPMILKASMKKNI